MDLILDIPVTVTVEVGCTKMSIRNVLRLNQGDSIDLNQLVIEPINVLVNGILVARGQLVSENGKFSVRLTDIESKAERMKQLRSSR